MYQIGYQIGSGMLQSLGISSSLPKFHMEYKTRFPADSRGFQTLHDEYNLESVGLFMRKQPVGDILGPFGNVRQMLVKRWKHINGSLLQYLKSGEAKPGDVYRAHPCLTDPSAMGGYGELLGVKRFQAMRNTSSPPLQLERGRWYVSFGFVDLQQLLEAEVKGPKGAGPVVWTGYEESPMAVARVRLVLAMLQSGVSSNHVLQTWYSASISPEAAKDLQRCCRHLAKTEQGPKVRLLLESWGRASLGLEEASARWAQHLGSSDMMAISQLAHEVDRTDYAHYLFTGQVFVPRSSKLTGNPTFFCLPEVYKNMKKGDENVFHSLDIKSLSYHKSLKITIEKRFTEQLEKLRKSIEEGQLVVTVKVKMLRPGMAEFFHEIQEKDPAQINWSNIPDYLVPKDFFEMARQCSGKSTQHSLHLMNWLGNVFGCNLMDYVNLAENYHSPNFSLDSTFKDGNGVIWKLVRKLSEEMKHMVAGQSSTSGFINLNMELVSQMTISEVVLSHRYMNNYMAFMFEKQDFLKKQWKMRPFSVLSRSDGIIDVNFTVKH